MNYFVSYELVTTDGFQVLSDGSRIASVTPGQCVITNSSPDQVMADLEAIVNDNCPGALLRVLVLTVLS